jgi:hypothetical protein
MLRFLRILLNRKDNTAVRRLRTREKRRKELDAHQHEMHFLLVLKKAYYMPIIRAKVR